MVMHLAVGPQYLYFFYPAGCMPEPKPRAKPQGERLEHEGTNTKTLLWALLGTVTVHLAIH